MKKKSPIHYGYCIVAMYGIILATNFMFTQPIGLYIQPVCEELGISQGIYSLSRTFSSFLICVFYLLYPFLHRRLGTKKLILLSLLCQILASLTFSFAGGMGLIFISAFFTSCIDPMAGQISIGNIINKWFVRKSSLAMSIIFACGNLGCFFSAKLIAFWISRSGWRHALLYEALIATVVFLAAAAVIWNTPEEKGLHAYGAEEISPTAPGNASLLQQSRPFRPWLMVGVVIWGFLSGVVSYPLVNFVPSILSGVGFDVSLQGAAVGLTNIGSFLFLPLLGAVADRFGVRWASVFCVGAYYLAMRGFFTLRAGHSGMAMLSCLLLGVSNIIFPLMPFLIRELFGLNNYSRNMSIAIVFRSLGTALGYPILGFFYDLMQSYAVPLALFCILECVLLVMSFIITKQSAKEKKRIRRDQRDAIHEKIG